MKTSRLYLTVLFCLVLNISFALTISGTITDTNSNPLSEVSVQMSGASPQSTETNSSGEFSFTVSMGSSYTLSVSKDGYVFSPEYYVINGIMSNAVYDFAAELSTVNVTGNVSDSSNLSALENVKIRYNYGLSLQSDSVYTDIEGNYLFSIAKNENLSIYPQITSYSFDSIPLIVSNGVTNDTTINFNAKPNNRLISGIVADSSGVAVDSVMLVMPIISDTVFTDENGYYSMLAPSNSDNQIGADLAIIPYKNNYAFVPQSFEYRELTKDTTVNFTAIQETCKISGYVYKQMHSSEGVDSVVLIVNGSKSDTSYTDENGYFELNLPYMGSYLISLAKYAYEINPILVELLDEDKNYYISTKLYEPTPFAPYDGTENVFTNLKLFWNYDFPQEDVTYGVVLTKDGETILTLSGINQKSLNIQDLESTATYHWKVRVELPYDTSYYSQPYYFICSDQSEDLAFAEVDTSTQLATRTPIILIHQERFNSLPTEHPERVLSGLKNYFERDIELRNTFKLYTASYYSNKKSIPELAVELRNALEDAGIHEQQIVIVAHGMGGLIARSLMNEVQFTQGTMSDQNCGDNVVELITLGTPHHGTPLANEEVRDSMVNIEHLSTLTTWDDMTFGAVSAEDNNRAELCWDNYDAALDFSSHPNDSNHWLSLLNTHTQYDARTICYYGKITPQFYTQMGGDEQKKHTGAFYLDEYFNMGSDGFTPEKSAYFDGHTLKGLRYFNSYDCDEIGYGQMGIDDSLFIQIKNDVQLVGPLTLTYPSERDIVLKHSSNCEITWFAPKGVDSVNIWVSHDKGDNWDTISTNVDAKALYYYWVVTDTTTLEAMIKIEDTEGNVSSSEYAFTIYHDSLIFENPYNSSDYFSYYSVGDTLITEWQHIGIGQLVDITLESYLGSTFSIANNLDIKDSTYKWVVPQEAAPTEKAVVKIEITDLESRYGDTQSYDFYSDTLSILGLPEVEVIAPNKNNNYNGEKLYVDSTYNVQWQTNGLIKWLRVSLCKADGTILDTITEVFDHIPGYESEGEYDWEIPEWYGDDFRIRIDAGPKADSITASTFTQCNFRINRVPVLLSPISDADTVSIYPCFETKLEHGLDSFSITLGKVLGDFPFNKTYAFAGSHFCLPVNLDNELSPGQTYSVELFAIVNDSVNTYSISVPFVTDTIAPYHDPIVMEGPQDQSYLSADAMDMLWQHVPGTDNYSLLFEKDGSVIQNLSDISRNDTSVHIDFQALAEGDTATLTLSAHNDYGTTSHFITFYKVEEFQYAEGYRVAANTWRGTLGEQLRTNDGYMLQYYPDEGQTYYEQLYFTKGHFVLDLENNSLDTIAGKAKLRTGEDSYISVYDGDYQINASKLEVSSGEYLFGNDFYPACLDGRLSLDYIDMTNLHQRLNSNPTRLEPEFSGTESEHGGDFYIDINHLDVDKWKSDIQYDINNTWLSMGVIKYELKDLDIRYDKGNENYYVIAQKPSLLVANNSFFSAKIPAAYGTPLGFSLDHQDHLGFFNYADDDYDKEYPKWDKITAFPSLSIYNTGFASPYMQFKYFDDEQKWGLEFVAALQLSIVKDAKGLANINLEEDHDLPLIKAEFAYLNAPPYIKTIGVEGNFMGATNRYLFGIGVKNVWELASISGKYEMSAYSSGKFKSLQLSGSAKIGFGPQITSYYHTLSVEGNISFIYKSSGYEKLSLSGDFKALRYINLANAGLSISAKHTSTFRDIYVSGYAGINFPSQSNPIIYGNIDFNLQAYQQKNSSGQWRTGNNMNISGECGLKIEKGLVDVGPIDWPSSDRTINTGRLAFGRVSNKSDRYGFIYNKTFKIDPPFVDSYKKTVGIFISIDDHPEFSIKSGSYRLTAISRSAVASKSASGYNTVGLKSAELTPTADTLVVSVGRYDEALIDFMVGFEGDTAPSMDIIAPSATVYDIDDLVANHPDLIGVNGYWLPLPYERGDWTIIVKNPDKVVDYTLEADIVITPDSVTIEALSQTDTTLNVQCSYTDTSANDADVTFFYAPLDSLDQKLQFVNSLEYGFTGGNLEATLDMTHLLPGVYHLLATNNDGVNVPQTVVYEGKFTVSNNFTPTPPSTINTYRVDNNFKVEWNYTLGANEFEIYTGYETDSIADTLRSLVNEIRLPADTSFYLSISSVAANGNISAPSSVYACLLQQVTIDTTPPSSPQGLAVDTVVIDASGESYAEFSWADANGADGYLFHLREEFDSTTYTLDVDTSTRLIYNGFSVGQSYYVWFSAYDNSENVSVTSDTIYFDYFNANDTDADGLIDDKEIQYFGNIEEINDPQSDPDEDSLSTIFEMDNGLNPNYYDTDGDHVWDHKDENPLSNHDNDDDNMADDWEIFYHVSQPDDDEDGDSLTNEQEYYYGTNPNLEDTDNGGLQDGDEVKYKLNPLDMFDDNDEPGRILAHILTYDTQHLGDSIVVNWSTTDEDLLASFNVFIRYNTDEDWVLAHQDSIDCIDDGADAHDYSLVCQNIDSIAIVYVMVEGTSRSGKKEIFFDTRAEILTTGISQYEVNSFQAYAHPNPFSSSSTITFYVAYENNYDGVELVFYNIDGQVIDMVNTYKADGKYSISWSPEAKKPAMYMCRIMAGNKVQAIKLLKCE